MTSPHAARIVPSIVENGWTGGQYSVVRACAGTALVVRCVLQARGAEPLEITLQVLTAVFAGSFAIGWFDRATAYFLAPTMIAVGFLGGERGPGQVHWLALAVMLHLATSAAPYGSWDARGRIDPRGAWKFPSWVRWAALVGLCGSLATFAVFRSHPYFAVAWYAALAFDPAWIPSRGAHTNECVFYDGECGLCHRAVRFLLAEDRSGSRFRFAPLQGETFASLVPENARRELPDSVVVMTTDGELLVRSRAALHALAGLGGLWRVLATIGALLPSAMLDLGYDFVARIRKRLFEAPKSACPMLPRDLSARFDP